MEFRRVGDRYFVHRGGKAKPEDHFTVLGGKVYHNLPTRNRNRTRTQTLTLT